MARGMSGYIDALFNNTMSKALTEAFPINVNFLAEYPDFFSFFIVMLLAVLLAVGVKESTVMNNIFTSVNLVVIAIVLVAGSIKGNCRVSVMYNYYSDTSGAMRHLVWRRMLLWK